MLIKRINESVEYINGKIDKQPSIGLILGSGLGKMADELNDPIIIPYREIPNFPIATAPGHEGRLVIGECRGKIIFCLQGRLHYYEGYSMQEVTYPIRIMQKMGIGKVIITNAAGGLNPDFIPGDLMVIDDHINFMGDNPLIGKHYDELGERFVDMSKPYDSQLIELAHEAAKDMGISLRQGAYVGYTGPSFETASEIKAFHLLGGSAVGMSTVPEVIVANQAKIKVLAITCVTNLGTGILDQPLSEEEVFETAKKTGITFRALIKDIIEKI